MKKKLPTRAELQRKVIELTGQLPCVRAAAIRNLDKAGQNHMMASGVIVSITALGGREIAEPFLIVDGLSDETITALKNDIVRSYDYSASGANPTINGARNEK